MESATIKSLATRLCFWTRRRYRDLVDFESFQNINRSSVESRGVELAVTWKATSSIDFQAQVTWNEVEDLTTLMPLLRRPRWLASGRLRWRPTSHLSLSFDARTVSETLDRQLPVPELERVAGYGLKQRKGGLPTRQRFDERSPCQESVIGLRWNR